MCFTMLRAGIRGLGSLLSPNLLGSSRVSEFIRSYSIGYSTEQREVYTSKKENLNYSTMYLIEHEDTGTRIARWDQCFGSLFRDTSIRNNRFADGLPPFDRRELVGKEYGSICAYIERHSEHYKFDTLTVPIRHGYGCTPEEAQWFWDKWVIPNIPKRLFINNYDREGEIVPNSAMMEVDVLTNEDMGDFYNVLMTSQESTPADLQISWKNGHEGQYFKKVTFNLTRIGPSDLYACLALIRYVQEASSLIHELKAECDRTGKELAEVFVYTQFDVLTKSGTFQAAHLLVDYAAWKSGRRKFNGRYSIIDRWPSHWSQNEAPYGTGYRRKENVSLALGVRPWELTA
jgi:hypothetical protein